MPECEEADAEGTLAILHQPAGDFVNGRDVIGIDRVAKAEAVGQQRHAEKYRLMVKE